MTSNRCNTGLALITSVVLVFSLALAGRVHATVFGLKSLAPGIGPSAAPTHLFSFAEDGSNFTDIGSVQLGSSGIDADALAISPVRGLLGFELTGTGSRLIGIDSITAIATVIGPILTGRDIRGAVFDLTDRLRVLDASSDELLEINPMTGQVVGTPVGLTLGGPSFDLSNGSDIAVRENGNFYLSSLDSFYTLDLLTGALTLAHSDSGQFFPGVTFSTPGGEDDLFAYEANFTDDLLRFDVDASFNKTPLYTNIIPSFNAGRGDLAAAMTIIPEPGALMLFSIGILGLLGYGWLRRKWAV